MLMLVLEAFMAQLVRWLIPSQPGWGWRGVCIYCGAETGAAATACLPVGCQLPLAACVIEAVCHGLRGHGSYGIAQLEVDSGQQAAV